MVEIIKQFLVKKNIQILDVITDSDGELCFKCYVNDIDYRRNINVILGEFIYNKYLLYSESISYPETLNFDVLIRLPILKKILPHRYIHHITYKGLEKKILIEGLTPRKINGALSNYPAIYLCNSKLRKDLHIYYFQGCYCSLLRIDTYKCNNTFYFDCNGYDFDSYSESGKKGASIMTYGQIPPEAIEFVQFMNLSGDEYYLDIDEYFKEKRTV